MIVSSFILVSLEPPLVAFLPSKLPKGDLAPQVPAADKRR
jgi:flavin reductase (DIM6/NTAB) family NADH-FMN oxidoreductase RutF